MAETQHPDGTMVNVIDCPVLKNAPNRLYSSLEATVDTTPQKLSQKLRTFQAARMRIPVGLSDAGAAVLELLFSCFDKQGEVKEGLVGDILWGFEQAGIPGGLVLEGLKALEQGGLVRFQAPDNTYVKPSSAMFGRAWVRYTQLLLDMVYEKGDRIEVRGHESSPSK